MTDKKKVLIVEDETTSRRILAKMLGDHAQCHFATDGESAVDEVEAALEREAPYDLICLDLMLPDRTGFDVLVQIRKLEGKYQKVPSEQPVVICTAHDDVGLCP
jgi:two-component system chemotaxis response regulator CheY